MKDKRKNLISNCIFAIKTIFKYAPFLSAMYSSVALLSGIFTPLSIYFLQKLVDSVTHAFSADKTNFNEVILWGALYVTALFGVEMFWFVQPKLGRHMNRKLRNSLSPAVIKKFMSVDYHYFEEQKFVDMVERVGNRPHQYIIYFTFFEIIEFFKASIRIIGVLALFFAASFWIGIGAALIIIPATIFESNAAEKKERLLRDATSDQRKAEYVQGLFADKNSMYEIRVFRSKNYLLRLWDEIIEKIFLRHREITKTNLFVSSTVSLLKIGYTAFAVIALIVAFSGNKIELGTVVSVIGSIGVLFEVIGIISRTFSKLTENANKAMYFKEFMALDEMERKDETEKTDMKLPADIVFENVSFAYPETKRKILHDVSFTVHHGEKAAIVGVNGAGKSTIIKLLCGLYKPDSGKIYIGGKDITLFSQSELSSNIAVVFQDFVRYELTLRENVAFGDLAEINNDKKLIEALKRVGAETILEKGLDTSLGRIYDNSVDISKGQWQRIAIARAFLSKSRFVVLDEPTASLDPVAESKMYSTFSEIMNERGTIIISHRLASAKIADKIIVLDGGEISAVGNHEQLMRESPLYSAMFEEQSSWYTAEESEAVVV